MYASQANLHDSRQKSYQYPKHPPVIRPPLSLNHRQRNQMWVIPDQLSHLHLRPETSPLPLKGILGKRSHILLVAAAKLPSPTKMPTNSRSLTAKFQLAFTAGNLLQRTIPHHTSMLTGRGTLVRTLSGRSGAVNLRFLRNFSR